MKLGGNEREMNDEYKSDKISNSIPKFFLMLFHFKPL